MSSAGYWIVSMMLRKSVSSASVSAEQKTWTMAVPLGCMSMTSVAWREPSALQVSQVASVPKSLPGLGLALAGSMPCCLNW